MLKDIPNYACLGVTFDPFVQEISYNRAVDTGGVWLWFEKKTFEFLKNTEILYEGYFLKRASFEKVASKTLQKTIKTLQN